MTLILDSGKIQTQGGIRQHLLNFIQGNNRVLLCK